MDYVSQGSVSPLTLPDACFTTPGAPDTGQFTCLSGTLTRLLTLQVAGAPRILDGVLGGTGLGAILLGSTAPRIRRALRGLHGQPVTACGTLRLGRGAHGVPLHFLDVAFIAPTSFGVRLPEHRLLRNQLFVRLLNPGLFGTSGVTDLLGFNHDNATPS